MFNPNDHLLKLKGKDYLQVMWRLVWFRDEKPDWGIETKLESITTTNAVFSAKIFDENGMQKSSGYGSESIDDFRDFIEKAETKAVGRALAMLGYGTQFTEDLDEGERIVDSPVQRGKQTEQSKQSGDELQTYGGTYAGAKQTTELYAMLGKNKERYNALMARHGLYDNGVYARFTMEQFEEMKQEILSEK